MRAKVYIFIDLFKWLYGDVTIINNLYESYSKYYFVANSSIASATIVIAFSNWS